MTVSLRHDQAVRLAAWAPSFYAKVGTVEGIYRKDGRDPAPALARAKANGHEIAFATYSGSALVNDGGAYAARERATSAEAVTLFEGDNVEIEGRRYVVRVTRGNAGTFPVNSNPIRFVPVVVEALS